MKPITNIYILADCSCRMNFHINRVYSNLVKTQRAIKFIPEHTKLHLWKYDDMNAEVRRFLKDNSRHKQEGSDGRSPRVSNRMTVVKSVDKAYPKRSRR